MIHGKKNGLLGALLIFGTWVSPAALAVVDTANSAIVASHPQAVPLAPSSAQTTKKINLSPLFIQLSDAMGKAKAGDTQAAKQLTKQLQQQFDQLTVSQLKSAAPVSQALKIAIANPTIEHLSAVSAALYAFEKSQNPVDYRQKRQAFAKHIVPAYDTLQQVIAQATPSQTETLRQAYQAFNSVWLANERTVRNTSMPHYGKIETAMALMRVAIETQPTNIQQLQTQSVALKQAIDSYNAGETVTSSAAQVVSLDSSIQLLRDGLQAFKQTDNTLAQAKLAEFIRVWPSVEGEVSTRNPSLYQRVESQIPVIMATGHTPKQQQNLQNLINELARINPSAQYSAIDAMLILLREGLEALLIIMALLSALVAAKQPQGKKWVYAGVISGLFASVIGALALQALFPAITSAANREMFEGIVGIVAVVMMIGVGAWLHSKSSVQSWNAYIKRHMGQALTTGSFVSLFGLSFLSVFREGAETILFYVGILPNISLSNFLLGIVMALLILAMVAWLMLKTSVKLPIPQLFRVLTWVMYLLGFKILGMSLHALQLTGYLPQTLLTAVPALEIMGFYPTLQTVIAQLAYIGLLVLINYQMQQKPRQQSAASGAAS